MARLNFKSVRTIETENRNLGKVIVFCEGKTEQNYFNYFAKIIERNRNKYSTLDVFPVWAKGNAQTVLNYANEFLSDEINQKEYTLYSKYLVFDCDSPPNIQSVIIEMKKNIEYQLLPSNLLFEIWLLMHFEEVTKPLKKKEIYEKMQEKLKVSKYNSREKAKVGNIAKIIGNGESVYLAIRNAKELHNIYKENDLDLERDILKMNPCAEVFSLVEDIMFELEKPEQKSNIRS